MTRRRTTFGSLALVLVAFAAALSLPGQDRAVPSDAHLQSVATAVPDHPWAERLRRQANAAREGDLVTLAEVMRSGDDVAAYRAARWIAGLEEDLIADGADVSTHADAESRLEAFDRVLALRIDEPLARTELRALQLERAEAAEAAQRTDVAVEAYREALPDARAGRALQRLLADEPYLLANLLFQGGRNADALEALAGLAAPSIEAPASRALGRHEDALTAYRAWLDQDPDAAAALSGVAWSLWSLDRLDEAEAAFARLPAAERDYGLALIANRRGQVDEAIRLLHATGVAARSWLATTLLEREERWERAIEVYLDLARGESSYADDAAWRARVLAERIGDDDAQQRAEAAIPAGSYFDLRRGGEVRLPARDDLIPVAPDGMEVVRWLAEAGDRSGARLVAAFALRDATERASDDPDATPEAAGVPWAQTLVALGEYRMPQRAAAAWLAAGSEQLRSWRLTHPRAWPEVVEPAAAEEGVDPHLVWSVMRRESAYFPDAVSRSGAQGLMQVMPATWDWIAELLGEPPGDPFDPVTNIRYGTHYLGWLDRYFDGDLELSIASYNRGQGYIRRLNDGSEVGGDRDDLLRRIDALETREYLQAVWVTYRTYQELERLEAGERTLIGEP
ncbi:MAG: transglycosylase SLT domain-containing protein [Trueperaceae bacterium]